jgi:hypothetical protein
MLGSTPAAASNRGRDEGRPIVEAHRKWQVRHGKGGQGGQPKSAAQLLQSGLNVSLIIGLEESAFSRLSRRFLDRFRSFLRIQAPVAL